MAIRKIKVNNVEHELEPAINNITGLSINGAAPASAVTIYVPTTTGTAGQFLMSNGAGAPIWVTMTPAETTSFGG